MNGHTAAVLVCAVCARDLVVVCPHGHDPEPFARRPFTAGDHVPEERPDGIEAAEAPAPAAAPRRPKKRRGTYDAREYQLKSCVWCGLGFQPTGPRARYCSPVCRASAESQRANG